MLGYAVTVKIHGASPPTGGSSHLDRTDWWDYVQSIPGPRVVVVQDVSSTIGLGALLGEVHVAILQALGCVGAVTNGSVRDLPAVLGMGFSLFAGSLTVSHSYVHIVEIGAPVEVDGITIRSGDLLHGDIHGVQLVPLGIAAGLPAVAARITAREQALVALCHAPGFSIEKLRAAVARESA
jgi:regulator of RNase E activity RraA